LLFVTASDWPVSLEIRGPRYRRGYESQILEGREQEAMLFWRLLAGCGAGRADEPAAEPAARTAKMRYPCGLERFRAKWIPVRVKKTCQNKNLELRF
jgi:hypothetical protein